MFSRCPTKHKDGLRWYRRSKTIVVFRGGSSYKIQQHRCRFDFVQVDNGARHYDHEAENSEHHRENETETAAIAAAARA